jgi:hypothetical protein
MKCGFARAFRDRELQAGEIISLQPRRYRIFAVPE